ncbi:MAG: glycosyltransferase family 39 protein [Opitutaceae bacterium]|nr:glycosyltransferase family 39 protein [Opitutaceae bacterium]
MLAAVPLSIYATPRAVTSAPPALREDFPRRIHRVVIGVRYTLRRWTPMAVAVAALLALYAAMAWTASWSNGASPAEGLQLAAGYNIWRHDDFRIDGANGDLVKRWATIPYLFTRPKFVGEADPAWREGRGHELANRFFFELGNPPDSLLRQGRAMITLLGVVTGLLVFWCSREIFGAVGGLISLAVFAFSPPMLAFGGIVSTDMAITLTLFAATVCMWRLLHLITPARLGASLAVTGLMVLAKPTALVIVPIAAGLAVVRLIAGGALIARWRRASWTTESRRAQLAIFAALGFAHLLAGWAAIWAHYEFRYTASPRPADATLTFLTRPAREGVPQPLAGAIDWIERAHFLPEGFRAGIDQRLSADDDQGRFMKGKWKTGGPAPTFRYAIGAKARPALFLLLAFGAIGWWWTRCNSGIAFWTTGAEFGADSPSLYATTPHLALIGCYLAVAMTEGLGHRHVLASYPALYVLAGAVTVAPWQRMPRLKWAVPALLGWLAVDSIAIRPHYLAYIDQPARGPAIVDKQPVDRSIRAEGMGQRAEGNGERMGTVEQSHQHLPFNASAWSQRLNRSAIFVLNPIHPTVNGTAGPTSLDRPFDKLEAFQSKQPMAVSLSNRLEASPSTKHFETANLR